MKKKAIGDKTKIRKHLKKLRKTFKLEKAKHEREKIAREKSRVICMKRIVNSCTFFLRKTFPNCHLTLFTVFLLHLFLNCLKKQIILKLT